MLKYIFKKTISESFSVIYTSFFSDESCNEDGSANCTCGGCHGEL